MTAPRSCSRTASRLTLIVVLGGLQACRGWLPARSHASRRSVGASPMALQFVAGTTPPRAGAGAYDGTDGIVFDATPGDRAAIRLYRSRYTVAGWAEPVPAIPGFEDRHNS